MDVTALDGHLEHILSATWACAHFFSSWTSAIGNGDSKMVHQSEKISYLVWPVAFQECMGRENIVYYIVYSKTSTNVIRDSECHALLNHSSFSNWEITILFLDYFSDSRIVGIFWRLGRGYLLWWIFVCVVRIRIGYLFGTALGIKIDWLYLKYGAVLDCKLYWVTPGVSKICLVREFVESGGGSWLCKQLMEIVEGFQVR